MTRRFYEVAGVRPNQVYNWMSEHGWLRDRPSEGVDVWTYDPEPSQAFDIGPIWSKIRNPCENLWETIEALKYEHNIPGQEIVEQIRALDDEPHFEDDPYRVEVDEARRKSIET